MVIALDELEALRLADVEGLYQEAAAARMGISRQTYARLLARARHAVASSLIGRRVLLVGDGPVVTSQSAGATCPVHGGPRRQGRSCHCAAACGQCGGSCGHAGSCPCKALKRRRRAPSSHH